MLIRVRTYARNTSKSPVCTSVKKFSLNDDWGSLQIRVGRDDTSPRRRKTPMPYLYRDGYRLPLDESARQKRHDCHKHAKHRDRHDTRYCQMYDSRLDDEQSEVFNRSFEQCESDHHSRARRHKSAHSLWQTSYQHKYQRYCHKPRYRLCKTDEIAYHLCQER